jgi:hypothetical protein
MDLVEIGWGRVDWIGLAQDRYRWIALVKKLMNLRGCIKCWVPNGCKTGGFSSGVQLHIVSYYLLIT